MQTEQTLADRYGVLLSLDDLADVLKRTPQALRSSLRSQHHALAPLAAHRLKIGRRMYFKATDVASFIEHQADQRS